MIYIRCSISQSDNNSQHYLKVTSKKSPKATDGFTLLELLVVIALLLIIAGAASIAYEGVQDQGRYDAARFEMAEIRKALLKFRRDSGTNDLPSQGIYNCDSSELETVAKTKDETSSGGETWPTGAPSADTNLSDWQQWCKSPANFWMLFIDPLDEGWNIDTRRGWNGPYLQRKDGYVDIGSGLNPDGTGSPTSGAITANLWGISSPYQTSPIGANDYYSWRPGIADEDYEKLGTPYFLFDLDNASDAHPARIVSLASDHDYVGDGDCEQTIDGNGYPSDHILCLLE